METRTTALAALGGGCVRYIEPAVRAPRGVTGVVSGYADGHVPPPTYGRVRGTRAGHAVRLQG
jgi:peptide-methionine (S)-S-oxide reductase